MRLGYPPRGVPASLCRVHAAQSLGVAVQVQGSHVLGADMSLVHVHRAQISVLYRAIPAFVTFVISGTDRFQSG